MCIYTNHLSIRGVRVIVVCGANCILPISVEKMGYMNMDVYGSLPPPLKIHISWTLNIYAVIAQLMLSAPVAVKHITARIHPHVYNLLAFNKCFPIHFINYNCV